MQWHVTTVQRTTILASPLTYAQQRAKLAEAAQARGNLPTARICDREAATAYKTRDAVAAQGSPVDSFAQFDTERERPAADLYDCHGRWIG